MFGGSLGDLLPLAVGIAISPIPIIACILMLFSPKARANGPAFLVGWVVGVATVTIAVYLLSGATGAKDSPSSGPTIGAVITLGLGVLTIGLAIRRWRSRPKAGEEAVLPAWMSAIDSVTPIRAVAIGFALSAINPKNLALAAAAGLAVDQAVAAGGSALALIVMFVLIASLSIAIPVVYLLVGGEGARHTLEGWRAWLGAHNAAVMATLFIVIGAKLVGSGLDAIL